MAELLIRIINSSVAHFYKEGAQPLDNKMSKTVVLSSPESMLKLSCGITELKVRLCIRERSCFDMKYMFLFPNETRQENIPLKSKKFCFCHFVASETTAKYPNVFLEITVFATTRRQNV